MNMRNARKTTAIAGVLVLIVTALPYLYAAWSTPPGLVYTGLMFDVPDHAQYWSWVTASRHALFISNTMTPEPNQAIFTNPMMWALAQSQTLLGLSFPLLFQWWRLVAVALVVPALVAFIWTFVTERDRRNTALVLALVGSGFGCLLIVAKKILGTADVPWPNDLYTVEPNTFWSLLAYPHIAVAHGLILLTMLGVWRAYRTRGWQGWVLAGVASALLSVSHAYDLITIYAVLGLFGLVTWIRDRQFPVRLTAVGVVVAVCSGPVAVYYQQLTSGDPLWRAVLSQYSNAGVWTPPHLHLIVLMGLPLLLAPFALARSSSWSEERWFVTTWAAVSLALIYLPVVYQIKLLSGWQFPLAVLATHAWYERGLGWCRSWMPAPLATAMLLLIAVSTNAYLMAWRFVDLRRHTAPYYLHQDQIDALAWLAGNAGTSDVVLAESDLGQFVPNYGGTRAYLAHWAMTNRFFERRANVATFFGADTPEEWRRALLAREGVTLVLRTTWPDAGTERFDPDRSTRYMAVFSSPRATIYRVAPPAMAGLTQTAQEPR